jgi:hypothetical protein
MAEPKSATVQKVKITRAKPSQGGGYGTGERESCVVEWPADAPLPPGGETVDIHAALSDWQPVEKES